jgi:hypothetical protein
MEETGIGRDMWSGASHPLGNFTCSEIQRFSEPCPFRFLWKLYYVGKIDYIIGHW